MTDIASRLAQLSAEVAELAALASEERRDQASTLVKSVTAKIDEIRSEIEALEQKRERDEATDTFAAGGEVAVCPRCTLRSFRLQRRAGDGDSRLALYACTSCGYQARREPSEAV